MKTICHSNHEHETKQAARACDVRMLTSCLAVMAWARDKLLREMKAIEEDETRSGIYTIATINAVAYSLDVENNPRLKA